MIEIALICGLSVLAYFAKGVTGAASAIVFNAGLLIALALGAAGGFTLLDGLVWIALADFFSGALLAAMLWRQLKPEKLTVLLLLGMLPLTVTFALLLPGLDLRWLSLVLALAVIGGGLYVAFRREAAPVSSRAANLWAFPTGALAGALSGLFGMGGPVVFILLSRASDEPSVFRRRAMFITLAATAARLATLSASGAVQARHVEWFAWAAPVMVAAMLAGMWAHGRIKPRPFRLALGLLVTLAGLGALLRFALL